MSASSYARRLAVFALVFGGAFGTVAPTAAEEALRATMECRVEAGTGRLLCTVALGSAPERVLRWSDAVVVSAPPSARPLRSRVASSAAHPEQIVIGFVLGSGEGGRIEVVVRAVSCPAKPRPGQACTPERRAVSYELSRPAQ